MSLDQSQTLFDLGVIRERERIIKLLEKAAIQQDKEAYPFVGSHYWEAIALIKGENK